MPAILAENRSWIIADRDERPAVVFDDIELRVFFTCKRLPLALAFLSFALFVLSFFDQALPMPSAAQPSPPLPASRVGARARFTGRWLPCNVPSSIRLLTVGRIGILSSSSPERGKFCIVLLNTQCEEVR